MTRVVIAAYGTRGDVAPLTGLGQRVRARLDAEVTIAAQRPYAAMITEAGLRYRALPGDTERDTRESTYGQAVVDGTRMRPSRDVLAQMREDLHGVGEAIAEAAGDADLLLPAGPIGSLLGYHVAEAADIPSMALFLQPVSATAAFAPPALTARSFGGWGNRLAWHLGDLGENVYGPLIAALRTDLGLPRRSRRAYQRIRADEWPVLYGFSRHVVPRPADWRAGLDVTGYWWPADRPDWRPPDEIAEFLRSGPPPVFISLGSTATACGEQLSSTIATALRKAGARAVIQTGWAGLSGIGPNVITVGELPHAKLFPQMAAIIHHGGAGTTAAALRAGVPSVPVTGIMDQPFWARRLHVLGAATPPLRRTGLTSDDLAAAITDVTTDRRYTESAQRLSAAIGSEDGAARAVELISARLEHHANR